MNAQPIDLILKNGRSHKTRDEIEHRKKSSISFGGENLRAPEYIKKNEHALAKWKECTKNYRGLSFVSSADIGHLARYCMMYAEYRDLITHRERISQMDFTSFEAQEILTEFEDKAGVVNAKRMWQKVEYILSVGGIFAADKAINAKAQVLTQMEDRLFLNPLAKIKNVPKPKEEEPKKSAAEQEFSDV